MSETTFENAKAGDRVYSPIYKSVNIGDKTNGTITINDCNDYSVNVRFDVNNVTRRFTKKGEYYKDFGGQFLFWENPIKNIPVRPKRMVMKTGYIGISPMKADRKGVLALTTNIHDTEEGLKSRNKGWDCKIQPIEFMGEE